MAATQPAAAAEAAELSVYMFVMQILDHALAQGADSLQAWQLLSQLQLQNQQAELAADAAAKGIKCLHLRQSKGYKVVSALSAKLVLVRGQSLLALGTLPDALAMFKTLTGEAKSLAAHPISHRQLVWASHGFVSCTMVVRTPLLPHCAPR